MADDFNPYHVWLGIPLKDQPANYYRLLSLDLFETSGDVIDSAADRQMAHLRTFQSGKHGDLTQRLLNEVAAARVCLLDVKKRAVYDQQLRAKMPAPAPAGVAVPPAIQPAKAPLPLQRAVATPPADKWDELLGNPSARPAQKAGGKSANPFAAPSAKQAAKGRLVSIGIALGVVLIACIGFGIYASLTGKSEGTLVFDWPDRTDVAVSVDSATIEVPAAGAWEQNFPAGPHHVVAQRPAYKLSADVNLAAGQRVNVPPDWKAKATLVLNWPLADRAGAVLKVDGRPQTLSQVNPLEVPVEPGRHTIQITRPGFDPIGTSALVAADGRELVAIAAPPAGAKLVFGWPAAERKNAELIVDGRSQTVADDSDSATFELTLPPGQHVVHITRTGFEPFNQAIDLSAGTDGTIKPTWTPEKKAAPTVADTPVPVEAAPVQPAKKLPVPAAAEQEKIAKQLNELYKTSQPGPKDPAKAQELYDVAAKDGSSPAERYILLMKGAEIAAAAGDLNLSLQGIDTLDADYDIDSLEAKQKLLDKFIAAGKPDQVAVAIPTAEQLVDQAVAADRFDIAIVLATTASKAVAKSKIATHKEDEERLSRRRHDIHLLEPIYVAAKRAQETLDKTPADPEANLTVGRWLCFYKGDWTTGLPMLAKGGDDKLKSLAEQEIKAPTDADQQVQLADAWWDLAQKEAGIARDSLHLHAGNIYQEAMPNLASALKKAAIEKRLAEIAAAKPAVGIAAGNNAGSAGTRRPAKGIDLLANVDTNRDSTRGQWTRQGNILVSDDEVSRVEFPTDFPETSYELRLEFSRDRGSDCFVVSFPVGDRSCEFLLSNVGGKFSGLDLIDGVKLDAEANPTARSPSNLENGHRYVLRIAVKVQRRLAEINCFLDDDELVAWKGNVDSLSQNGDWKTAPHRAAVTEWHSPATVYSARVGPISTVPVSRTTTAPVRFPSTGSDRPLASKPVPSKIEPKAVYECVLGVYTFESKPTPFVNLSVPSGSNLLSPEVTKAMEGKMPGGEVGYTGTGYIVVPRDGTYEFDQTFGDLWIDGRSMNFGRDKGTTQLRKGTFAIKVHESNHGQPYLPKCKIAIREVGGSDAIPILNSGRDIEAFLGTPISGVKPILVAHFDPAAQKIDRAKKKQ